MFTATANHKWIKDPIKVATKPILESLAFLGIFFDDISDFNCDYQKSACSTSSNLVGGDKGVSVSYITGARPAIAMRSAKYYEDVGRPIEPNVMEWSQIKHINYLIQIQYNWINPDLLPYFSRTMHVIKFMYLIHDHLRNKLGISKIPLTYVARASIAPDSIGYIIPTLPYSQDAIGFR